MPDLACLEQLRDLILQALPHSLTVYTDPLSAPQIIFVPSGESDLGIEQQEPAPDISEGLTILGNLRAAISQIPEIEKLFEDARQAAKAFAAEYERPLYSYAAQTYSGHPTVVLSAEGETRSAVLTTLPNDLQFDMTMVDQIIALIDSCLLPQLDDIEGIVIDSDDADVNEVDVTEIIEKVEKIDRELKEKGGGNEIITIITLLLELLLIVLVLIALLLAIEEKRKEEEKAHVYK